MSSANEDNLEASANEMSNIEDDFDSLFEQEDIRIDSEKGKHDLNFNQLFEQISEECTDSLEGIAGDSPEGNVDDDFEALLGDETTNFVGKYAVKDDNQETLVGKSVAIKGFNQIFSSDTSDESNNFNPDKEKVMKYRTIIVKSNNVSRGILER